METFPFSKKHEAILTSYDIQISNPEDLCCFHYRAGEVILHQSSPILYFFFIISGKARVCVSSDNGRDLYLSHYVSEGIIGDIELMAECHTSYANVIATSDFKCIALPYEKYAPKLKSNIEFINFVGKGLALKLIRSSKGFQNSALHSGEERICSYILDSCSNDEYFEEVLTNVSGSLGISYRHMFRILNKLCDEHVLKKSGHGYEIIDRKELVRRAPK